MEVLSVPCGVLGGFGGGGLCCGSELDWCRNDGNVASLRARRIGHLNVVDRCDGPDSAVLRVARNSTGMASPPAKRLVGIDPE